MATCILAGIVLLMVFDISYADEKYPAWGFWYNVIYDKPFNAVRAEWKVKHGYFDEYTIDIPAACWLADAKKLRLRLYSNSNDGAGHAVSWPECYDGKKWLKLGKTAMSDFGGYGTDANPSLMADGDWDTYAVWNEIGPIWSSWQTDYSNTAPRWYDEKIEWHSNLIRDGDFRDVDDWFFYTNGGGDFTNICQGRINVTSPGTNVQLYQDSLTLEAGTRYRLSFRAYSNTGHDLQVTLVKNLSPYTNYGLKKVFNLTNAWQTFTVDFATSGFVGTVSDGRLMFWLAPYDAAGDQFFFDNVILEEIP